MTDQDIEDTDSEERGFPIWATNLIALTIVVAVVLLAGFSGQIMNTLGFGQEAAPIATMQPQTSIVHPSQREETYTVKSRDTLYGVFGQKNGKLVCQHNHLKDCNTIKAGWALTLPAGVKPLKTSVKKATHQKTVTTHHRPTHHTKAVHASTLKHAVRHQPSRDAAGWWHWTRVGGAPLTKCTDSTRCMEEAMDGLGLIDSDKDEMRQKIAAGDFEAVAIPNGTHYQYMSYYQGGKVRFEVQVLLDDPDTPVTAKRYRLSSGRVVDIIDQCGNWGVTSELKMLIPPPPPPATPPATPVPPQEVRYEVPVVEARTESEDVHEAAKIEYEAIAGVWVGQSGLANFRGAYAEGLIKFPVGDGTAIGVGGMGMIGAGKSRVSDYSWHEHKYGPEVALYHDRLGEDGLPIHDGLKLRYLFDGVRGHNPESGYKQKQSGHGVSVYAEHVERTSPTQMWGVTGEAFVQTDASQTSTWAGDKPQNRSLYAVNAFGQTVLDKDYHWQVRYGAGFSHQSWDKVNYLSLFGELRYDETIMCGPRLSLALNRPASYKPYSITKLNTLMGFCRIELGGKLRAWDRHHREEHVTQVQTGWRPLEPGEPVPTDARQVTEGQEASPDTARDLGSIDLTGIGSTTANDSSAPSQVQAVGQ